MNHVLYPGEDFPFVHGRYLVDGGSSPRGWHRLMSGLRCPQLLAYQSKLRIVMPETEVLARGSLVHAGLAAYYRRLQAIQDGKDPNAFHGYEDAMRIVTERADSRPTARQAPEGESPRSYRNPLSARYSDILPRCLEALRYFVDHASRYPARRIIAVERVLQAMIPSGDPNIPGQLYTQRADLIEVDLDGFIVITDHKTRGKKDIRQERAYARSGQFQGYHQFGRTNFPARFGGCYIQFITMGDKKTSIERVAPPVYPWRIDGFVDTIRHGERIEHELAQRNIDPWRYPKVGIDNGCCEHRYGPCEAAVFCDYGPAALAEGFTTVAEDRNA